MLHTFIYRHFREAAGEGIPKGTQENFRQGIHNGTSSEESSQNHTGQSRGFSVQRQQPEDPLCPTDLNPLPS